MKIHLCHCGAGDGCDGWGCLHCAPRAGCKGVVGWEDPTVAPGQDARMLLADTPFCVSQEAHEKRKEIGAVIDTSSMAYDAR